MQENESDLVKDQKLQFRCLLSAALRGADLKIPREIAAESGNG